MELQEAKAMLNLCERIESRDHAFGDKEVFWIREGKEIASGYFGGGTADVFVQGTSFQGAEAHELKDCGAEGAIHRNDETGPDVYIEGYVMPGLTKEYVRHELEN